ncbi:serine hydrolase [Paenibacillus sp. BC26]|uniref:serine hydrolase domain-containing protein n=1 Tax=Paenibacillus sp. BC26 TaxID=1881032 RepID=UPI0008ED00B7|nr:serine hydrolase [Paenibacillus sp. BC26]SFT08838.1 CubicO group peptidase, beta-lactamase class C family [Paenibacillus sp. BC26]
MENRIQLPRSKPEEQGVSSKAIMRFLDVIGENNWEVHGFMLLRHGHVIAEGWWAPYRSDIPHALYSLSKSFVSTAIGFAEAEGLLSLDDRIVDLFPEELPETVSENLSALNIRHLLMMATGHAGGVDFWACADGNWVRYFLETPIVHTPGTYFAYNTCATYMLCAIIQRITGQSIDAFLEQRLFVPLDLSKVTWDLCPRGITYGGMNFTLTNEDIAKFGQLYLQRGEWKGKQLLPASWIDEASAFHVSNGEAEDNDWTQGYGYQFWRCRHNSYRADGAFGQFSLVMPEQDAVLAVFSGTAYKHELVSSVWETLLPGMSEGILDPDETAYQELSDRLKDLRIDVRLEESHSKVERLIQDRIYALEPNREHIERLSLLFDNGEAALAIRINALDQSIRLGRGFWVMNDLSVSEQGYAGKAAGSFRWREDETLEINLACVENSFRYRLVCRFEEERVELDYSANLYWDWLPQEGVLIQGHS